MTTNTGGRLGYFLLFDDITNNYTTFHGDNLYEVQNKQFVCTSNGVYSIDISGYFKYERCDVYKKTVFMVNGVTILPTYEPGYFMSSGPEGRFLYSYQLGLKKGDIISFKHIGYEYEGFTDTTGSSTGSISHDDNYIRVQGRNSGKNGSFEYGFGIIPWYYALSYDENGQITTTPVSAVDNFEVIS